MAKGGGVNDYSAYHNLIFPLTTLLFTQQTMLLLNCETQRHKSNTKLNLTHYSRVRNFGLILFLFSLTHQQVERLGWHVVHVCKALRFWWGKEKKGEIKSVIRVRDFVIFQLFYGQICN
jgi:hypothetical protein